MLDDLSHLVCKRWKHKGPVYQYIYVVPLHYGEFPRYDFLSWYPLRSSSQPCFTQYFELFWHWPFSQTNYHVFSQLLHPPKTPPSPIPCFPDLIQIRVVSLCQNGMIHSFAQLRHLMLSLGYQFMPVRI